jgi:hypothetical protein
MRARRKDCAECGFMALSPTGEVVQTAGSVGCATWAAAPPSDSAR